MTSNNELSSRIPGFYNLSLGERHNKLAEFVHLTPEERFQLKREALSLSIADGMVENLIGVYGIPLGVAMNFRINGRDVFVPMAVEESSIVAAASHIAKLVREHGRLESSAVDALMTGQIQVVDVKDPEGAKRRILDARERILQIANEQDPVLREMGGGAKDIEVRVVETRKGTMVVVHLFVDVRDAMGANAVNTMSEALGLFIEGLAGGKVLLRILSNLADRRLARATLEIAPEAFDEHDWRGEEVVEGIVRASAFAEADVYRAATHNKGIMNGIDALMIATGNDWRAVEAGAHAYAARDGNYRPLSTWERTDAGMLRGEIELPLAAGIIGGATRVHPLAQVSLKILGVQTARELAAIAAAVGLAQNLGALRSLVTEGIQKGHMVLHARNVAISAGAVGDSVTQVANQMIREGRIRFDRAAQILGHVLRGARGKVQRIEDRLKRQEGAPHSDAKPDRPESGDAEGEEKAEE